MGSTSPEIDNRALHIVDLENLVRDPICTSVAVIERVWASYLELSAHAPGDEVLIAGNRFFSRTACFVFDVPCRYYAIDGRDGADNKLIRMADIEQRADRFTRLVIGSGDHIFGSLARRARRADLHVTVISARGSLAKSLARTADTVHYLPAHERLEPEARRPRRTSARHGRTHMAQRSHRE